jgi:hypothetical protein
MAYIVVKDGQDWCCLDPQGKKIIHQESFAICDQLVWLLNGGNPAGAVGEVREVAEMIKKHRAIYLGEE